MKGSGFLNKIGSLIFTLWLLSLVSFFLIRMIPGDPVRLMVGDRGITEESYQEIKKNLGLDKPILLQYKDYVVKLAKFDLGTSFITRVSVWEEFKEKFKATAELSFFAMLIAISVGLLLGIYAAVKRGTIIDKALMTGSVVGFSMPIFWWGLILILYVSVRWGLTPVSGRISAITDIESVTGFMLIDAWFSEEPWPAFKDALSHLILPSIVLATVPLASIARMTRSSFVDVLSEDYIRTAYSKGLSRSKVYFKHALRNALLPVVTVIGLMMGALLTGAILTETIFSWPGLGRWLLSGVESRDFPVIQAGIFLIGSLVMILNFLIDAIYKWVNPRLRV